MTKLFNHRYRIPSARAQWWDYGNNAAYFITICTLHRRHYFGEIQNWEMDLSSIGIRCWHCWYIIPNHFPFVKLDAFVVMPNHVHGIIIIDKTILSNYNDGDAIGGDAIVETQNFASLQFGRQQQRDLPKSGNHFGPQSQNLGSIVRGFKIGVTKYCRENDIEFGWQPRYHDHIIRDRMELERIQNYIRNNPGNWKEDLHYL